MIGLYCVYDRAAEECGPIFESKNDVTALRAYNKLMETAPAPAIEYKLMCLGYFDRDLAEITPNVPAKDIFLPRQQEEGLNG